MNQLLQRKAKLGDLPTIIVDLLSEYERLRFKVTHEGLKYYHVVRVF